jgi:hypothetical protein
VSQAQARIREAVTKNRQDKLTALLHHINIDVLQTSFFGLKKTAAPGVDEMTWTEYAEHLEANLLDLHARVHTGAYRALPSLSDGDFKIKVERVASHYVAGPAITCGEEVFVICRHSFAFACHV